MKNFAGIKFRGWPPKPPNPRNLFPAKISDIKVPPKHPRGQKKLIGKKMAKKNSQSVLSLTFDFDPEEYLDKSLLFGLKISSEKNFFFLMW